MRTPLARCLAPLVLRAPPAVCCFLSWLAPGFLHISPSSTTGIDMHGLFDPGHLRACPFCIRSVRENPGLSWAISGSFGRLAAWAGLLRADENDRRRVESGRPAV